MARGSLGASAALTSSERWSPEQAAEFAAKRDIRIIKALSRDPRAEATARRLGVFAPPPEATKERTSTARKERAERHGDSEQSEGDTTRKRRAITAVRKGRAERYGHAMHFLKGVVFRSWRRWLDAQRRPLVPAAALLFARTAARARIRATLWAAWTRPDPSTLYNPRLGHASPRDRWIFRRVERRLEAAELSRKSTRLQRRRDLWHQAQMAEDSATKRQHESDASEPASTTTSTVLTPTAKLVPAEQREPRAPPKKTRNLAGDFDEAARAPCEGTAATDKLVLRSSPRFEPRFGVVESWPSRPQDYNDGGRWGPFSPRGSKGCDKGGGKGKGGRGRSGGRA